MASASQGPVGTWVHGQCTALPPETEPLVWPKQFWLGGLAIGKKIFLGIGRKEQPVKLQAEF